MNQMSSGREQARSRYVRAWRALLQHGVDTSLYGENEQVVAQLEDQHSFTAAELRSMRMRARTYLTKK